MPPVVAWASTTGIVLPPLEAIEIGLPNAPIAVALPLVPRLIVFAVTVPDVLVNAPVGLSVIEPVSAERLPASAIAPALTTTTLPPPVSLMPVIVSGAAVLISAMFPLVVLVALKAPTVLALFSVAPPTELVVSVPVVEIRPAPLSLSAPLVVRLTAPPPPALTVPVMLAAPVLFTTTLPPPVSLMPVIVSGAAVLISAMFPLVVLVALKLDTVLALFSVVPVAESAVNRFALMSPAPDSLIAPVAVRLTFPLVVNAVAMDMFSVAPPVMNVKLSVPVSALNPAVLSTVIAPLVVDSWIVCPPVTVLSV